MSSQVLDVLDFTIRMLECLDGESFSLMLDADDPGLEHIQAGVYDPDHQMYIGEENW